MNTGKNAFIITAALIFGLYTGDAILAKAPDLDNLAREDSQEEFVPELEFEPQPEPEKVPPKTKTKLEKMLDVAYSMFKSGNVEQAIKDIYYEIYQVGSDFPFDPKGSFFIGYVTDISGEYDDYKIYFDETFKRTSSRFRDIMTAEEEYAAGIPVDWLYEGGRVCKPGIKTMPKSGAILKAKKPNEWNNLYFNSRKSKKLQQILKDDPLINFEQFDNFMIENRNDIQQVFIDPEGYILIGIGAIFMNSNRKKEFGPGRYTFIIQCSPKTEAKIYKL